MRVDVVMPQMGESIAEGTITRWIKQVGETVRRDEPLFEISTDKVDAEIPSPSAGTLVEIKNQAGETVPVNQVVAVLETDASRRRRRARARARRAGWRHLGAQGRGTAAPPAKREARRRAPRPASAPSPRTRAPAAPKAEARRAFVSPVVRKIAAEHGIDPSRVPGTGAGAASRRRTSRISSPRAVARPRRLRTCPRRAGRVAAPARPPPRRHAVSRPARAVERQPMSPMRKKIAEHMLESRRTSAHVHSIYEVDMTRIVKLRDVQAGVRGAATARS
jgi:2-oxoglutarate dehydrogenase E2 component (dihydrolipoamide succinyltransferase)